MNAQTSTTGNNDRVSQLHTAAAAGAEAGAAHGAAAASGDETVTKTTTTTTRSTEPGFFGRIARKLEARPIATSVGLSLGTAAATAATLNYKRYGSVMPTVVSTNDVGDVVAAIAGGARALFGR